MTRMLVLVCSAALALVAATAAPAAQPQITDLTIPPHSLGLDPFLSDVCGFDVEVLNEGSIRRIEYSDGSSLSQHNETYYWQGNGRTLVERVSFSMARPGDGTTTFRGTVFHLIVPGVGPALVEAGQAVFGPNGDVIRLDGLHQVLEGPSNLEAVCGYLAA